MAQKKLRTTDLWLYCHKRNTHYLKYIKRNIQANRHEQNDSHTNPCTTYAKISY